MQIPIYEHVFFTQWWWWVLKVRPGRILFFLLVFNKIAKDIIYLKLKYSRKLDPKIAKKCWGRGDFSPPFSPYVTLRCKLPTFTERSQFLHRKFNKYKKKHLYDLSRKNMWKFI